MTEEESASSASDQTITTSGDGTGSANDEANQSDSQDDEAISIKPEDHKRAINDLHKFKSRWKESETRIDALQNQIKSIQTKGLQEKEDFKTLYEKTREELESERQTSSKLKDSVLYSEKYRAVFPALKKAGLRDDAETLLEMQSLGDLDIETTNEGRFLVNGVDTYVEIFKSKFPFAFEKKKTPNFNSAGGSQSVPGNGTWNPEKLFHLENECKKKGDMVKYHQAVTEWVRQGKPMQ